MSDAWRCAVWPDPCCSHLFASVTKQYNLVPAKRWWCFAAGKITAGLAESNCSLPPGGWLIVTCGLTAYKQGSALGPALGSEYGKPLPFNGVQLLVQVDDQLIPFVHRTLLETPPIDGYVAPDGDIQDTTRVFDK